MPTHEFATLKPITLSDDSKKDEIKDYYVNNNITPDNPFMIKFLDKSSTTSSIPNISTPSKDIDIAALLANRLTNTPISSPEKALTDVNVNVAAFTPTASVSQKAKEVIKFFMGKGYSKEISSGIAGNLFAESHLDHTRHQNGGGPGFGLAQWEGPRQADFKRVMGKDIHGSSVKDQLEFLNWEMNNSQKNRIKPLYGAKSPAQAAELFAKHFERMKKYNKERESYANTFYTL